MNYCSRLQFEKKHLEHNLEQESEDDLMQANDKKQELIKKQLAVATASYLQLSQQQELFNKRISQS